MGESTDLILYGTEKFSSECTEFGTRHAVVQFIMALRYKPEGRKFDYLWCQ